MQPKNEKSVFRHRGFQCSKCDITTMVFGNDVAPTVCPNCDASGTLSLQWDHIVTSVVTVSDTPKSAPVGG